MRHPLLPVDLEARRRDTAPGTSLGALADALTWELEPLVPADLAHLLPQEKARLTRTGGRCPVHGSYLEFNPWQPHVHACVACARTYEGEPHDAWWRLGAQLWFMERAVHAAALHALRGEARHRQLAESMLDLCAARYPTYPNQDNVLGPSRPFFSTYLESLWLLNACHALALLEWTGPTRVGGPVRERLIAPSAQLIAGFHEGRSNRQVWNAAAQLSAAALLGDTRTMDELLQGPDGLVSLLRRGFSPEGGWYEGENYHLFAHRGAWFAAQAMTANGHGVPADVADRLARAFAFPFSGLLPDDCMPSRKDAQYGVSIRQWRIAEYLELGYAATGNTTLAGLLTRVYDGTVTRPSDARARSTGEAERNEPPMWLSRADLSWRALLCADPAPVPSVAWQPASACRHREGLAVIRREQARVWVGLEGGGETRGHGHPDNLALSLQTGATRWLDDPGTGSYVDPSLFWYRSTLAHHAPMVNGTTQPLTAAAVLNFEDRGGAGWVRKRARLAEQMEATRTVVVADGYLVDHLEWEAPEAVTLTLPIAAHVTPAELTGVGPWESVRRHPGGDPASHAGRTPGGHHDPGFAFLEGIVQAPCRAPAVQWQATRGGTRMAAWWAATNPSVLLHAMAPGPPGSAPQARVLLETEGVRGAITSVWAWAADHTAPPVLDVAFAPAPAVVVAVTTRDGTRAEHGPVPHGWHIALSAGGARSSIDLEGAVREAPPGRTPGGVAPAGGEVIRIPVPAIPESARLDRPLSAAWRTPLAAPHYVATETPYGPGNAPTADVALAATPEELVVRVRVTTGHAVVSTGGTPDKAPENPLDNEPADVNADGLQWYLGAGQSTEWAAAGLVAPLGEDRVRLTPLAGSEPLVPSVQCMSGPDGWEMQLAFSRAALPAGAVRFHLTINERPAWRERRRGQLRMAGGGFRRYIAGPREDAEHCPHLLLLPEGERRTAPGE